MEGIIAILDFVSEDDSMVVVKTGCTAISKDQIATLFKNWEQKC